MNEPKRRRGLRRGLSLLLSLCMVVTLLPISALAEAVPRDNSALPAYTVTVSVDKAEPYCTGDDIFLMANVKDANTGAAMTTGKVQFYKGDTTLGGAVSYSSGGFGTKKGFSLSVVCGPSHFEQLDVGNNSIKAVYTPSGGGEPVTSASFTVTVSDKLNGNEYISSMTVGNLTGDGVNYVAPVQFGVSNNGGDKGIQASDFVITGTKDGNALTKGTDFTVDATAATASVKVKDPGTYVFTAELPEESDYVALEVSDSVVVLAPYTITYTLEHLTAADQPAKVNYGKALSATLTAEAGYKLPRTIAVSMAGTALNTGYTYDSAAGTVGITHVTGDVVITAKGEPDWADGGEGTSDSPYLIKTYEQLTKFAQNVNGTGGYTASTFENIYIQLDGSFPTNGGSLATAIGTDSNSFKGHFDGSSQTVKLAINASASDYQGLFGYVDADGEVKNVTVSGTISGKGKVGGVAGMNRGTVENCVNAATVTGGSKVGGVVGSNTGTVEKCVNAATVTGNNNVGGVAGYLLGGTVSNCYNTGTVSGENPVGGVAAQVGSTQGSATVKNCVSLGATVTATDSTRTDVGRVAGNKYTNSTLTGNKARGDMKVYQKGDEEVTPITSDAAGIHGKTVDVGDTTALSGVFSGWDTNVWNIPGGKLVVGGDLPTLKGITQTQNPTLPEPVQAAPTPTANVVLKNIYANGAALILAAGNPTATNTVIYIDKNGNGEVDSGDTIFDPDGGTETMNGTDAGNDLSGWTVYGGSKTGDLTADPKITMTGGKVNTIYGGSASGSSMVTGNPTVAVSGGEARIIYGGSDNGNENTVKGDPAVAVTGGTIEYVYGGGNKSPVTGNPTVAVSGGKVNKLYGGSYGSSGVTVSGNSTVTVSGGEVGFLYGGGSTTAVTGAATVSVTGGTVTNLYGGGYGIDATVGSTSVTVGGGAKIGDASSNGVVINGGSVTNGVASFVIEPDLTEDASVYAVLPTGYDSGTIATSAVQGDLAKIKLTGAGAAGKAASFADGTITVKSLNAAEYSNDGGATWTKADTLDHAITAVQSGGTVRLLADGGTVSISKKLTLDLNGHTLDGVAANGSGTSSPVAVANGGELTLTDSQGGGGLYGLNTLTNGILFSAVNLLEGGKLTLTGDKPFTLRGGDGVAADSNAAKAADGITAEANTTVTISGTGAILIQGGNGGQGNHYNSGGSGVDTKGDLNVTNPNATLQGGDAGAITGANQDGIIGGSGGIVYGKLTVTAGRFLGGKGSAGTGTGSGGLGGNGCSAMSSSVASVTGGVFQGGQSGGESRSGGDGLALSGTVEGALSGLTCTGGAGGVGSNSCGLRLWLEGKASFIIESGRFAGAFGVHTYDNCTVQGGVFTGDRFGLSVDCDRLTVTGGTFTGGMYGLQATADNTQLSGGTFTGDGVEAYAVINETSGSTAAALLATDHAYFGADGKQITEGLSENRLGQNTTLRVAAKTAQPEKLYGISGTVNDAHTTARLTGMVSLLQDGNVLQEKAFPSGSGESYHYTFTGVAPGVYTVVAVNTTGNPGGSTTKTATILVTVKDADVTGANLGWDVSYYVGTEVDVKPGTPPVAVGGLDKVVQDSTHINEDATVLLTAEKQDAPADADKIIAISGGKELDYLALTLQLVVTKSGVTTATDLGKTNSAVLELVLPYDFTGKQNVTVYRHHDGTAEALTPLSAAPATPADGTFWADTAGGYLHIYASKFSTYAVGYVTPSTGGSTTTYTLTATAGEGGKISPSGAVNVSRNSSKTFTIKPDEGYEIADVLVDGKSVGAVTSYTFEGVTKAHSIAASFTKKAAWNPFADVKEGAWYYDSVKYVYEHGLMSGTGKTAFSPGVATTRGMIVTILWRLEGEPESKAAMAFTDVKAGRYYFDAIRWAAEHEIVKGYTPTEFGPNDPVTRQELAAILYRCAQYKGMDVSAADDLTAFTDRPNPWAEDAVKWAVGAGIISGKGGGVLDPTGHAARSETAAMLQRFVSPAAD